MTAVAGQPRVVRAATGTRLRCRGWRQEGILQSTYETLAECARQHFEGSLRGRLVLTAGLGAMGGAQPLAISFLDGVALVVEVDEEHADRRLASGYLEDKAHSVDEALRL